MGHGSAKKGGAYSENEGSHIAFGGTLGVYKTVICARYYVFSCLAGQCQGRIGPLLPGCVRKWARLGQNSPRPPSVQYTHPSAHPEPPHQRPTSHPQPSHIC